MTNPPAKDHALVDRLIAGCHDEADLDRVVELWDSGDAPPAQLVDHLRVHGALAGLYGDCSRDVMARIVTDQTTAPQDAQRPRPGHGRTANRPPRPNSSRHPRQPRRRSSRGLLVMLSLLLLLGGGWWMLTAPLVFADPVIEVLSGSAVISTPGSPRFTLASGGQATLQAGATIHTDRDGTVRIDTGDGSSLLVRAESSVSTHDGLRHWYCSTGGVAVTVSDQPLGRSWRIATPRLRISVGGTAFSVLAREHRDRVVVDEGWVHVRTDATADSHRLDAGQRLEMNAAGRISTWQARSDGRPQIVDGMWMQGDGTRLRGPDIRLRKDDETLNAILANAQSSRMNVLRILVSDDQRSQEAAELLAHLDGMVRAVRSTGMMVVIRSYTQAHLPADAQWTDTKASDSRSLSSIPSFWSMIAGRYAADPGVAYQMGLSARNGPDDATYQRATAWTRNLIETVRAAAPDTPLTAMELRVGCQDGSLQVHDALARDDVSLGLRSLGLSQLYSLLAIAGSRPVLPGSIRVESESVALAESEGHSWILMGDASVTDSEGERRNARPPSDQYWQRVSDDILPLMPPAKPDH